MPSDAFDIDIRRTIGGRELACAIRSDAPVTALTGVSGVGKTSVLNMIAGLMRPADGHIRIAGETLFDAGAGTDIPPERRRIGYVFQDNRLFPHMSVRANLDYGARLSQAEPPIGRAALVELLGIGHLEMRRPASLSGGEARRVAIGRALLSGARCLLLDEPLTSLDAGRREEIMRLIEDVRDAVRLPILLVSHEAREIERLAGRIVTLAA